MPSSCSVGLKSRDLDNAPIGIHLSLIKLYIYGNISVARYYNHTPVNADYIFRCMTTLVTNVNEMIRNLPKVSSSIALHWNAVLEHCPGTFIWNVRRLGTTSHVLR